MKLFCTQNQSMTIPTVRNVEHGKSFVLIGCGSHNSKSIKSYGHLKKRKKATDRSVIRFDGIGESLQSPRNARACSHCSTRYLRYMDHRGNKGEYGSKACLLKLQRNKRSFFATVPSSSFSVPHCFARIHQHAWSSYQYYNTTTK